MRYFLVCLIFYYNSTYCQFHFPELDKAIAQSAQFDKLKEQKIVNLKKSLEGASGLALVNGYEKLYEEYKVFNYDSAYHYALSQITIASRQNNSQLSNCSRIKLGFVFLSAGLFKEAFDNLQMVQPNSLPDTCKKEYFTLMARCYYDLADYTKNDYHTPKYNALGNAFLDSALVYQKEDFEIFYYKGLRNIRAGKIDLARLYLIKLINDPHLTLHQTALATSTMSDIYIQKGRIDSAMTLLVKAAIADIKSSTKETSALFNLSSLLFKEGDLKNASAYIEKAAKDAVSYGARQRKVQMSTILPLIEGEKIARVESEKRTLVAYAIVVTFLLLTMAYLIFVITRQNKKLKEAQKALTKAHLEQQEINGKLIEANKIKVEYIAFFFNANSVFFDRIEWFKRKAEQKMADAKFEELLFLFKNLNIKQERNELLKNFDAIFLKIFPHFISLYNKLFHDEDQVQLKENEVLNTELRIFALFRLGIQDNDKIAAILGYSVNTINTYKTRIKNRSLVSNEQFEERIMQIRSA